MSGLDLTLDAILGLTAPGADLEQNDWRGQLRLAVTIGARITAVLHAVEAAARHPVAITPYYLGLIVTERVAEDPIARQCLPDMREITQPARGDVPDPFGDSANRALPKGLVHRYPDRIVVLCTRRCAVYCRHCTRRNLWRNGDCTPDWEAAVAYVHSHPEIREVILSGGDPLLLEDDALIAAVERFAAIDRIDAVRIGTRVPVVLPMRVTPDLARAIGRFRKVWINTQFNHPRELTEAARESCARLIDAGIPVSNQNVILAGVNDDTNTLCALFSGLQRMRVRPYYAFAGDPVAGTAHLRASLERVRTLARETEARLGGLALPRFVADLPGAAGKIPVERLAP